MDRWLEFMGNHPFLFGILAVLIILFFTIENKRSGKKISANTLGMMVNSQNAKLIDIRTPNKFAQGHIKGSRNVPFAQIKEHLPELRAIEHPIIIICDAGIQAGAAIQLISKSEVYRLDGGVGAWQSAGMPLVGSNKGQTHEGQASSKTKTPHLKKSK